MLCSNIHLGGRQRRHSVLLAVLSLCAIAAQAQQANLFRIDPEAGSAGLFRVGMTIAVVKSTLPSYRGWTTACTEPSNGWPFFGSCVLRDAAGDPQLELRYNDPMAKAKVGAIEVFSSRFRTSELLSSHSLSTTLAADGRSGFFIREQGDGDAIEPAHFVVTAYPRLQFYAGDGKELAEDRRVKTLRFDSGGRVRLADFNRALPGGWPVATILIQ